MTKRKDRRLEKFDDRWNEKQEHLKAIRAHLVSSETITRSQISALVNVSDATATRYAQILENDGLLKQIGKTGKHTKYQVKSNSSSG